MQTVTIKGKDYTISVFDTESSIKNKVALNQNTLPSFLKTDVIDFSTNTFIFTDMLDILKESKTVIDFISNFDNIKKTFDSVSDKDITLAWLFSQYGNKQDPLNFEETTELEQLFRQIDPSTFPNRTSILNVYNLYLTDPQFFKPLIDYMVRMRIRSVPSIQSLIDIYNIFEKRYDIRDIALTYIYINHGKNTRVLETDPSQLKLVFLKLKELNPTDFWSESSINSLYNLFIDQIDKERYNLEIKIRKEDEFKKQLSNLEPVEHTDFIQDSIVYEIIFTSSIAMLDLFNSIKLTEQIPFVQLYTNGQQYFKLFESFLPPIDWMVPLQEESIEFKLGTDNDIDMYNTCKIEYKDKNDDEYIVTMTIEIKMGMNETELKMAILDLFVDNDFKEVSSRTQGLRGSFAIPEILIARDVMLDILTNNYLVNYFLYVDESRSVSSRKSSFYIYYGSDTDVITAYVSERYATRKDPFFQEQLLPLFTPYMNIRISRALSIQHIKRFQQVFSVFIRFYINEYSTIVKRYSSLIPQFKEFNPKPLIEKQQQERTLKLLQEKDPELFIYGYARDCQKKQQPVPIDTPTDSYDPVKMMRYPRDSSNYFICPNKKFPYPGLLRNKLENKDTYPYLPCCYPESHYRDKKLYYLYDQGLDKDKEIKTTTNYVQIKAITDGKKGFLPRNIHYILSLNTTEKFIRIGTIIDTNSFLHSVLLAIDPLYSESLDKTSYALDVRHNIANMDVSCVIQQLYTYDNKQLSQEILNYDIPLDSSIHIGLLEAYFNCRIFVFERSINHPNCDFEIPQYTQSYLYRKIKPSDNVIFIYKHMGLAGDRLSSPHYELVVVEKSLNVYEKVFSGSSLIVNNVESMFLQTYKNYIFNYGDVFAPESLPFQNIKQQYVDIYGKCRGFVLSFNNKDISILTSPYPPLPNIPIVNTIHRISLQLAMQFSLSIKNQPIAQDVIDNSLYGVFLTPSYDMQYTYIPLVKDKPLPNIPQQPYSGYILPSTSVDILSDIQQKQRIADFLMQYSLYGFSIFLLTNPYTIDSSDIDVATKISQEQNILHNLVDVYSKTIKIKPNHDYDIHNVSRKLTLNSNFFDKKSLIVDSNETLQRISYYISYMIQKNKLYVVNFHKRKFLENFYLTINDFYQFVNQKVFISYDSIKNWLDSFRHGITNKVNFVLSPDTSDVYLFSHWSIDDGRPVFIQNVKNGDLTRALSVIYNFNKHGLNTGFDSPRFLHPISYNVLYIKDNTFYMDTVGSNPIGSIIKYTDNIYAAILFNSV
jgi:hypothetical protein